MLWDLARPGETVRRLMRVSVARWSADLVIPVSVTAGLSDGPNVLVVAGAHGTELLAQDVASEVVMRALPRSVQGKVGVVLVADVAAAAGGVPNICPSDGKNVNRLWPGDANGTVSEALAHWIWTMGAAGAHAVVDLHGGEWYEEVEPFAIVHRTGQKEVDERSLTAARTSGLKWVEITDATGAWLGRGTLTGECARTGRVAVTLEVGGRARRGMRARREATSAVLRVLRSVGALSRGPAFSVAPAEVLLGSDIVRSRSWGVLEPVVKLGEPVAQGEVFSRVKSFVGDEDTSVLVPREGFVMLRSLCRVVVPDGFVGKVGVRHPVAFQPTS